jgi:hemerythrin-like metal-binding protein
MKIHRKTTFGSNSESAVQTEEAAHQWQWDDALSTGIASIDVEHRELVNHYHALVHALFHGASLLDFEESFRKLVVRVRRHFVYEERIMMDLGYEDFPSHKAEHDKLLTDAADFLLSIPDRFEPYDCSALAKYVKYWLIDHIANQDKKLASFLRAHVSRVPAPPIS